MVGYSETMKAYNLWNPATENITLVRGVVFDESIFPEKLNKGVSKVTDRKTTNITEDEQVVQMWIPWKHVCLLKTVA